MRKGKKEVRLFFNTSRLTDNITQLLPLTIKIQFHQNVSIKLWYSSYQLASRVVTAFPLCSVIREQTLLFEWQSWIIYQCAQVIHIFFFLSLRLSSLGKDRHNNLRCRFSLKYFWKSRYVTTGMKQSLLLDTDICLPSHYSDLKTTTLCLDTLNPPLCSSVFGKHLMAAVCVWPASAHLTHCVDFIRRSLRWWWWGVYSSVYNM